MGGGMQAVRPQLFAQEPSRRLSAGQVEAYLYIWSLAGLAAAAAGRVDDVRGPGQPRILLSQSDISLEEMHDSLC